MDDKEIQNTILCERRCPEEIYPAPLNSYYPVPQWATARLILILQCIIGFKSQSTDFANAFSQADIPSGKTVFIELPM